MRAIKILSILLVAFGLAFLAIARAQVNEGEKEGEKYPLREKIGKAIEDLGSPRFMVREKAAETLMEMGEKAVPYLESAAKSKDPDISRRARWILQEMEAEGTRKEKAETGEEWTFPLKRFPFRWDYPFSFPKWPMWGGHDEMKKYLEELRKEVDEQLESLKDLGKFESESKALFTMVMQKNGKKMKITYQEDSAGKVRVTVEEEKDGQKETKTYEAKSRKEFEEKYPDVFKDMGMESFSFRFSPPGGEWGRKWRFFFGFPDEKTWEEFFSAKPGLPGWKEREEKGEEPFLFKRFGGREDLLKKEDEKGRLGIYVEELSDAVREHLNLEEGMGLLVVDVVEGSLAEKLGIQVNDVVFKVKENPIQTPEDVRDSLMKEGIVKVEIIRKGERKVLTLKE